MPDGRFAVMAVPASGKVFRDVGLATLAEVEESAEVLGAIMAACGASITMTVPLRGGSPTAASADLPISR